jgi:hypothetical protein
MSILDHSYRVKFPCRHSIWVTAASKKEAIDVAEMQLKERHVFVSKANAEILGEAFDGFMLGKLKKRGYQIVRNCAFAARRATRRTA